MILSLVTSDKIHATNIIQCNEISIMRNTRGNCENEYLPKKQIYYSYVEIG